MRPKSKLLRTLPRRKNNVSKNSMKHTPKRKLRKPKRLKKLKLALLSQSEG